MRVDLLRVKWGDEDWGTGPDLSPDQARPGAVYTSIAAVLTVIVLLDVLPRAAFAQPKERATFQGHTKGVRSVSFSPDGKTLAFGSSDATIKLWDVQTGKEQ